MQWFQPRRSSLELPNPCHRPPEFLAVIPPTIGRPVPRNPFSERSFCFLSSGDPMANAEPMLGIDYFCSLRTLGIVHPLIRPFRANTNR